MLFKSRKPDALDKQPLFMQVDPVYKSTIVSFEEPPATCSKRAIVAIRLAILAVSLALLTVCVVRALQISRQERVEQWEAKSAFLDFESFTNWQTLHGKAYNSRKSFETALSSYARNKANIERWNKESDGSVVYGENHLSDLSDDEFQKMLMPKDMRKTKREDAKFIQSNPPVVERTNGNRPDFFDWRDKGVITPVKAQGKCGSCWAFAATATVEAAWKIAYGEERILSEQTLLDCDLNDNACDGGDEDKAFRFIHREGLAYLNQYPYVAKRQDHCMVEQVNRTKIAVAYFLNPDADSMIDWLLNFGPVNIGMSVTQPMRAYKEGVFHPTEYACKHEVIGLHAMLITGYGTSEKGEDYWIVKNSWGDTFGDKGYIKFARGFNACFIEDEPVGILA